jgi:hypothetical protein
VVILSLLVLAHLKDNRVEAATHTSNSTVLFPRIRASVKVIGMRENLLRLFKSDFSLGVRLQPSTLAPAESKTRDGIRVIPYVPFRPGRKSKNPLPSSPPVSKTVPSLPAGLGLRPTGDLHVPGLNEVFSSSEDQKIQSWLHLRGRRGLLDQKKRGPHTSRSAVLFALLVRNVLASLAVECPVPFRRRSE